RQLETLEQHSPWANWLIILVCCFFYGAIFFGYLPHEHFGDWVLQDFSFPGLVGHIFLHGGFGHLLGNMIFLWVFGNAVCGNVKNVSYLGFFFAAGILAACIHLLVDGSPAIGASGAVNGVVGLVLAMYPINRVEMLWVFFFRFGTFRAPVWAMIFVWLAFDIYGVVSGEQRVAYWAHLGGLMSGFVLGLVGLHFGWLQLTTYDNRSFYEILRGEHPE
ncbi:MAG: rhomboid family intramembrane serine protease, partial [Verrucomicrobiales bacterium]